MMTQATSPISQIEALAARLEKARELAAEGQVFEIIGQPGCYAVACSNGGGVYLVGGACPCPDAQYRIELTNGWCKHRLAVEIFKEARRAAAHIYRRRERLADAEDANHWRRQKALPGRLAGAGVGPAEN